MALAPAWKRFAFFDKQVVKNRENDEIFDGLKNLNIAVCTSGRGKIILGDVEGNIYTLSGNYTLTAMQAYDVRVSHLQQMKQYNILVSVGDDEVGRHPVVKVWNQDKLDENDNMTCTRILQVAVTTKPLAVTAIAVHENMNYLAVGFVDGSILVVQGDVTKERQSKTRVLPRNESSITGLSIKQSGQYVILFSATTEQVQSYNLTNRDHKETLDYHGCSLNCTTLSDVNHDFQFVVGTTEAVYFYQHDDRGPCFGFDGVKYLITWFKGYLVVVTKDINAPPRPSASGTPCKDMFIVSIYDIQNKYIAYSAPIPGVVDVLSEWGSLYILTSDNKLILLKEKDSQTKLELLFKRNCYSIAISLAKSQRYDYEGLIDIFRKYANNLYSKGDYDGSVQQYIKTIGYLEPSYVIRRFLDAQRIHNLTSYLQALHKNGSAESDHTTLLLNCYTKLRDNQKLNDFIMTKERNINYNVETAIRVCRQAGYYEHALFLAEKHSKHKWYLRIQLEDTHNYTQALNYIAKLEFTEAEKNLMLYGKTLLNQVPDLTTEILKKLCTDYRPSQKLLVDADTMDGNLNPRVQHSSPEHFIHIFVNNSGKLVEFLEHIAKEMPDSGSCVYNTLLELYLQQMDHTKDCNKLTEIKTKAKDILLHQTGYDVDQAMILCLMHNFSSGILFLYEKEKLYQHILQHHIDNDDDTNIIDLCKRYGNTDPTLWTKALDYFTYSQQEGSKAYISEVLNHIDKHNLLPPILVIQTLAKSSANLATVKDYITKRISEETSRISTERKLIDKYKNETERLRSEIDEMKTNAKIFRDTRCSACSIELELPTVHFLCLHSYHQSCFEGYSDDSVNECPRCAAENRKMRDIVQAQGEMKNLNEQFHHQLARSHDGFSVVADYFGRGVFNKLELVTDARVLPPPTTALSTGTHLSTSVAQLSDDFSDFVVMG